MDEQKYIMIKGIPNQLKTDLQNIAKNTGVTLAGLLKPELRKIAESYPQQMKVRRPD